jgi:hypothetical protein
LRGRIGIDLLAPTLCAKASRQSRALQPLRAPFLFPRDSRRPTH